MTDLIANRIRDNATKLALPNLHSGLEELVARAEKDSMGYLELIDLILDEEVGVREGRKFRHMLRASRLPHHKTIDEFDFTFQPGLDKRKVRDLATLSFIESKTNVAFLGPPGVGKTHLAVSLAVAAARAGYSILFTTLDDMIGQLTAAQAAGKLARKMLVYTRPSVLVLDEVGYLPLERNAANLMFQLVSKRYENGPILLTSNKSFKDWGEIFSDTALASAILDRVLHHCEPIAITGPSWRMRNRLAAIEPPGATGATTA